VGVGGVEKEEFLLIIRCPYLLAIPVGLREMTPSETSTPGLLVSFEIHQEVEVCSVWVSL
jgi:hypothetical protein